MIPPVLHHYWEGPRPEWVDEHLAVWREMHPAWQIVQSSPDRLPDFGPLDALWGRSETMCRPDHLVKYRSNLVRYAALWAHGGVWVDADMVARRPIDELLVHDAFLPAGTRNPQVAIIGATAGHPFIGRVITAALAEHPSPLRACTAVRHVDVAGTHDVTLIDHQVLWCPTDPNEPEPSGCLAAHVHGGVR